MILFTFVLAGFTPVSEFQIAAKAYVRCVIEQAGKLDDQTSAPLAIARAVEAECDSWLRQSAEAFVTDNDIPEDARPDTIARIQAEGLAHATDAVIALRAKANRNAGTP